MLTLLRLLLNVINTLNSERQLVTAALPNPDFSFTILTAGTTTEISDSFIQLVFKPISSRYCRRDAKIQILQDLEKSDE